MLGYLAIIGMVGTGWGYADKPEAKESKIEVTEKSTVKFVVLDNDRTEIALGPDTTKNFIQTIKEAKKDIARKFDLKSMPYGVFVIDGKVKLDYHHGFIVKENERSHLLWRSAFTEQLISDVKSKDDPKEWKEALSK